MNWKLQAALFSAALVCAAPVASAADAAALYGKHCKSCHGADGKGDTKMGKKAKAKDYTTAEGQKWSDEEGVKVILEGKEKMKGYKEKGITEDDAKALVKYIRAFKK